MITRAVIAAVGARTPLGLTATQTSFLLRTGSAAMAESPLLDGAEETVTMCFDPTIDRALVGADRAARLAAPALAEALGSLGEAGKALRLRLVLCIDERFQQKALVPEGTRLSAEVHTRAREIVPGIELEVSVRGAAGAAFVLPRALEALAAKQIDGVLLGGVHTDYDPLAIKELENSGRLFSTANTSAVIPGESAAFVLLMREDLARRAGLEVRARIAGVGSAVERANPDNDVSAFEANGLTTAVRTATGDFAADSLAAGWSLTDHTFEVRRMHEWQAMVTRTRTVWCEPHAVDSPAQRLGHVGAAAMPLALVLASEAFRRGHAPAPVAIALAGSDAGERGAIVIVRP